MNAMIQTTAATFNNKTKIMSNKTEIKEQLTVKEALEQGNRLIAEFHGWKHFPTRKQKGKGYWDFPEWHKASWNADSFEYHRSWDWLMPVVEKIADTPMEDFINHETEDGGYAYPITFGMRTEIGQWMVRFRGHALHEADTLILAAYAAVVDFIEWYNTKNNNQNEQR